MIAGPATLTVLILVAVLLVAGAVILKVGGRRRRQRPPRGQRKDRRLCQHCQHENPRQATYCARCGKALEIQNS